MIAVAVTVIAITIGWATKKLRSKWFGVARKPDDGEEDAPAECMLDMAAYGL